MAGLGSWLWGTKQLDEVIDKATSELLPAGSEDIALNLEICDQIRSKAVPPKDAVRSLKRRINHKNPNVQLLALGLTDVCVKNGGDHFLAEVASREFMDNLASILKSATINRDVRSRILRYIQNWALAFGSKPHLSYVGQVYKDLKREGLDFPPEDLSVASSAMVDTQTAPEWIDSDVCLYCRDPFTFTNRKHHCRNCGRVFDQKCSTKTLPLPHFGIMQEVRVCESCHKDLTKHKNDRLPYDKKSHRHSHGSRRQRQATADEEADLQRAIRLSLEQAYGSSRYGNSHYVPSADPAYASEPPLVASATDALAESEDDPDLKAAIEASLREANAPRPSAPVVASRDEYGHNERGVYGNGYPSREATPRPQAPVEPTFDLSAVEADTILTFSQTIEQVNAQGGRDLARYPAVTQLLDRANGLRPKLAMSLEDTGHKEEVLADMNDKLSQAVKLYDQLLTEQLSRPRYQPRLQQQQQAYQPVYAPPPPPSAGLSYNPPGLSYQSSGPSYHTAGPSYQPAAPAGPSYQPPVPVPSFQSSTAFPPEPRSPPPVRQSTHPVSSSPTQALRRNSTLSYQAQYAPATPAPVQRQYDHSTLASMQYQHSPPAQPQYASSPPPSQAQFAPTSAPPISTSQLAPQTSSSQVAQAPSQQPYQPQYAPPPPQPTLSQPPSSQPQSAPSQVYRPAAERPQAAPSQQHQVPYASQQQSMPVFPVVPSNPPTAFDLQELTVPNGFSEPVKEASLIEL